jgi:hypothetical protein
MMAQSKKRRIKTPIDSVRNKFEEVHRASQSEMPIPVLVRTEPISEPPSPEPPSPEPVESVPVKSKKSNAWIIHVKSIAEGKGIKFRDALRDPETKATYKK